MASISSRSAGGIVTPPATQSAEKTWYAAYEAAPEACRWTRKLVNERLDEAMRVVARTVGPVRPKGYGSSMPEYFKDPLEIWFERMAEEEQRKRDAAEQNRVRLGATLDQITRMEAAIWWPMRYLDGTLELPVFNLWLACKAQPGRTFSRACRDFGLSRDTAKDRVGRAALIVATGLILDRVPTGADLDDAEPEHPRGWGEALATPDVSRETPAAPPAPAEPDLPEWWPEMLAAIAREPARANTLLWAYVGAEWADLYTGIPGTGKFRAPRFQALKRVLKRHLEEEETP